MPVKKGTLFIVSTPIGNLADITFRAVETLKTVSFIAAEDTRRTRKLLNHFDIKTKLISYYEHNRFARIPQILQHLESGKDVAVVTDAGTPGVSDPAYKLIRSVIQVDVKVEPIPGPSAFLTALVASGLPTSTTNHTNRKFKKGRRKKLSDLASHEATLILYENPKRVVKTLSDIATFLGDRPAVVCRELTKVHEEIIRGTISELLSYFSQESPKGECVIMIGKDDPNVYFG